MNRFCSPVAQLVEQVAVNHLVGGSSPSRGANKIKILWRNANKLNFPKVQFVNKKNYSSLKIPGSIIGPVFFLLPQKENVFFKSTFKRWFQVRETSANNFSSIPSE